MAHRIVKKAYKPDVTNESSQPGNYNNVQSGLQLPRPVIPKSDQVFVHDKTSYRKGMHAFPPAESVFVADNQYDAGPEFMRPTSAVIMGNPKKRSFPLAAWLMPFGGDNVQKVQADTPLRCVRCKAYVNPYFRFDGTKTYAVCNICGMKFEINSPVYQKQAESPEVCTHGVIDLEVKDKLYMRKRLDIIKIMVAI